MMKKLSIALLLIVSVLGIQAQTFPGQPRVTVNGLRNVNIPCGGAGCIDASAVKMRTGVTNTYTIDTIPFLLFPITGATSVIGGIDDKWSSAINIPFTFCFFGSNYNQMVIGSNGIISFNTAYATLTCPYDLFYTAANANPIPNPNLPINTIMGPYQDIDPRQGGSITYQTLGQAPRRIFVVSFNQVPQYSCNSVNSTNQIVIYEGTNIIETYITNKALCPGWNGGNAIEGIQNSNGTVAYAVPGRNNVSWTTSNSAHRFTPSGNATAVTTTAWHQLGSTTVLSTADSVQLCPPTNGTTQFIVDVTYYQCDPARTVVVSDTLTITVAQSAGPDQYLSCPTAVDSVVMNATGSGTWVAVAGNPTSTVIHNPTSPTTSISGFGTVGTYYYAWTSPLCTDTAAVIVSSRPDAGPDKATCVGGTVTMSAVGTGTWTALSNNPAATTIVTPTSPTTSISGFSVGGTYNFVWHFASCVDTVTVLVPVFTTSTTGDTSICKYTTTTISASAGPSILGPFTYQWLNTGLVQSPNSATTQIRPLQNTTDFVVLVTAANGCTLYDTVHVNMTGVAPQITITPSAIQVCPGDVVNLNPAVIVANLVNCGTLVDTIPDNALLSIGSVGSGTTNTTNITTPYTASYRQFKAQYLVTAAEMNAAGLSSGAITDLSFFVTQLNTTAGYDSFSISMGCTSQTVLSGSFNNTLLEVLPPTHIQPNAGWSPHPFQHYFNWDGVSNIIVQVCYKIGTSATSDFVASTVTAANSVAYARSTSATALRCSLTTATFSNNRPNMRFGIAAPNTLQYQWTPPTGDCDTCSTVSVTVTRDSTYYLTVSDHGCVNTGSGRVSINPYIATLVTPHDTSFCSSPDTVQLNLTLPVTPSRGCVSGYTVSSIPYASISGTATNIPTASYLGSTGSNDLDDGISGPLPIGFNFPFYCNNYAQVFVSTNAWISFTNPYPASVTSNTWQYTPQAFPPSAANRDPLHEIALLVSDYYLTSASQASYFMTGTAPNRIFVMKYTALPSLAGTRSTTGEIHLYETTGVIEIMLQNSTMTGSHTTGVKDTVGVGLAAPGRNNQAYTISAPEGWMFTPNSAPTAYLQHVLWTPNGGTLSNDTIVNPIATPSATTTYIANVDIAINQYSTPEVCHVRDSAIIRMGSFTHTLSASPDTVCIGSNSQLTFSSPDSVISYVWTPGVPILTNASIKNPTATLYDTTTFYVTAINAGHCTVTDSVTVFTYPTPHPSLGRDTTVCYTDSVVLGLPGSYSSYEWYKPGTAAPVATTPTITALPNSSYVLKLHDAVTGCFYYTDTLQVDSFAHPRLAVTASGPVAFCNGSNVVLQADPVFTNWKWSNGLAQQSIPVSTGGSYSYTASDAHNCVRYSDTTTVVVSNAPSIIYDRFKPVICANESDSIVVHTVPAGVPVTWTGPTSGSGDTIVTSTPGTYQITASAGCPTDSFFTLSVAPGPQIDTLRDTSICSCTPVYVVTASATSASQPVAYSWSDQSATSDLHVSVLGTNTYTLTVTDASSCTASASVTVSINCFEVHPVAIPDTVFAGQSFGLIDSPVHTGAIRYQWTPADSLDNPTSAVVKGTAVGTQPIDTFYLTAYDSATGCSASSFVQIHVINHGGIAMATAFTPNGDGMNDRMYPVVAPGTTVTDFRIYNRWGQTVHNNPNAPGWDGSVGGNAQGSDTYTYYVTTVSPDPLDPTKKITKSIEGSFQLFR